MNQESGGPLKAAFVGGVRNPALERAQYGFTAGAEYVGGTGTAVYVGSFTDVAKGKEIAMQMYQDDMKLIQAYAGGAGMGVYQAAESLPEGEYTVPAIRKAQPGMVRHSLHRGQLPLGKAQGLPAQGFQNQLRARA